MLLTFSAVFCSRFFSVFQCFVMLPFFQMEVWKIMSFLCIQEYTCNLVSLQVDSRKSLSAVVHLKLGLFEWILKPLEIKAIAFQTFMCLTQRCTGPRAQGSMGRDNDRVYKEQKWSKCQKHQLLSLVQREEPFNKSLPIKLEQFQKSKLDERWDRVSETATRQLDYGIFLPVNQEDDSRTVRLVEGVLYSEQAEWPWAMVNSFETQRKIKGETAESGGSKDQF
jgi:hypothetical protein